MNFTLTVDNANELCKFAKAYIDPKSSRTNFSVIGCHIEYKMLTATMVTDISCCRLILPVDCDTDGECFLFTPSRLFKKSDVYVKVTDTEEKTTYKTAINEQSYRKPELNDPRIFDLDSHIKPATETFYMNPKKLATALSVFNDVVRIDYVGKIDGIVISDTHAKALVLPVRPPKGEVE